VKPGALSAAAVLSLALGACLLPQEDTLLSDDSPPVNQPPAILEAEVQPSSRILSVDGGTGCPDLVFSAPVEDPDVGDTLYFDFYVDSDAGSTGQVAQGTVPPSGTAQRVQAASYTVSFASTGPVQTPGTHLVEVLVADGPLVNGIPLPRTVDLPDGGTRTDVTFAVSYAWLVTVTAGPCP
jgi:hypothetical protein